MGQKSYLRVDGVRGSSSDLGHVGEMEVSKFSYITGREARSANVRVSVQMEAQDSYVFFYDKMTRKQKLKDATLTVETRDRFNRVSQDYKAEMKGLMIIDVKISSSASGIQRQQPWSIQTVTFWVDSIQFQFTRAPELKDEWSAY